MLEQVMTTRSCSLKVKLTVKGLVSFGLIVLAVLLPQLVHLTLGQAGGVRWLPMYLPVLLAGCLLGVRWGMGVGVLSPVVSFALTTLWGDPMPAAARLPFMMAELCVFAAVSGIFSKQIAKNGWMAFPAVLLGAVAGRAFFLLLAVLFQSVAPFTVEAVLSQIEAGLSGLVLQAAMVPLLVMGLRALIQRERE
ncbi:MAG TPA: hypothetical protein H9797_03375 [Candidatus Gallimonas gallistercoris]|uniref:ECF transporter S component n=1 Tax=Candidatus Gallimonas gallistercoris TaxID=2838602 RepID=A0A9D2H269_9FIRM|nr:hypothetical protein [Candidatus Gallimonas gallistercoris]